MKQDFEVITRKIGKPSEVKAENPISVSGKENIKKPLRYIVEDLVIKYINEKELRNIKKAERVVRGTKDVENNNQSIDVRLERLPEAKFQNELLHIIRNHDVPIDDIKSWVKSALAENSGEDSIKMYEDTKIIMAGVESCNEAINSLQKEFNSKYEGMNQLFFTDNSLDAYHQIDVLSGIEKKDNLLDVVYLVQVKSHKEEADISGVTEAHQSYINGIPQLVGRLNIQKAKSLIEGKMKLEVIDIDRNKEKIEQITLFGLVLDEYISLIKNKEQTKPRAIDFYEIFKKEGGKLDPFTFVGVLKNEEIMNEYRRNQYFKGDRNIENILANTVNTITYTDEESMSFYRENCDVHTILDGTKIISLVMIKGKKLSEIELKHPEHFLIESKKLR